DAITAEKSQDLALLELQRQTLENVGLSIIGMNVLDVENRHGSVSSQINFLHLGAGMDLLRRAGFENFAEMQHRNLRSDVEHNVHVVLDQKNCQLRIELHQELRHLRRFSGGKAGGGFVEQQNFRIAGEAEHDLELALFAVRQIANFGVLAVEEGGVF